jgi:hypothetical protein
VRARFPRGAASMLCGHVHRLERIDYGGGRELLVLPPFYEEGRFVVASGDGLRVATLAARSDCRGTRREARDRRSPIAPLSARVA